MPEKYEIYRGAADRVRRGWARGSWTTTDGRECLVQSILSERRRGCYDGMFFDKELPTEMLDDLDKVLSGYPSYRLMKTITQLVGGSRTTALTAWNDYMGTQERVAKVLETVSEEQELEFLRAENVRLKLKVESMKQTIEAMTKERETLLGWISALEQETSKLKRLTNSVALRADREQLAALDIALDEMAADLSLTEADLGSERFNKLS